MRRRKNAPRTRTPFHLDPKNRKIVVVPQVWLAVVFFNAVPSLISFLIAACVVLLVKGNKDERPESHESKGQHGHALSPNLVPNGSFDLA